MPTLKKEYQDKVDLVKAKPYLLKRIWNWKPEDESWDEDEIARSKSLAGIKAFIRLNKIPSGTGEYRIEKETVELVEGWYPQFENEFIEEL